MAGIASRFADRSDAGRSLAGWLQDHAGPDTVVVGLARGGMPVAAQVARALAAPLDVCVVRKLGVPAQPELAFGAIASGGVRVLNPGVVAHAGVTPSVVEEITAAELAVLRRREGRYRAGAPRSPSPSTQSAGRIRRGSSSPCRSHRR